MGDTKGLWYVDCDKCGKKEGDPHCGYVMKQCSDCVPYKELGDMGVPHVVDKVHLNGYGEVSVARLKELESRVMLPVERKDGKGDYYVGTKLPNGKIVERTPDFRP